MQYELPIVPAPTPPPQKVDLDVKWFVTRGDGRVKVLHSLYGDASASWQDFANVNLQLRTVLVPIDMFTALQRGLVTFDELALPESTRALFNLIKP